MKWRLGVIVCCLLLVAGWWWLQYAMEQPPTSIDGFAPTIADIKMDSPPPPSHPSVEKSAIPISFEWVRTKKIIPIVPVGTDSNHRMICVPSLQEVSWYKGGAIPGNAGNAIIAGHRDWNGVMGVFQYLEKVSQGERVVITYQDKTSRTFEVVSKQAYPVNQIPPSVMGLTGRSRVTLITCTGVFNPTTHHYNSRAVVVLYPLPNQH